MIASGTWSSYAYDHEDRLVSMSNASTTINYIYDYMGRRIRKTVTGVGAADTKFLWQGWTLVADLNAADGATPLRGYIWGPDFSDAHGAAGGAGSLLAQTTLAGISYALPDLHGNIAGYLNASGTLVAAWEYSPYGKIIKSYGAVSSYPIGFSGKYTDTETGLVYYGLRYYNPKHGRFVNRDPSEEQGGLNLYAFVGNSPMNAWDVLGLGQFCHPVGYLVDCKVRADGAFVCTSGKADIPVGWTCDDTGPDGPSSGTSSEPSEGERGTPNDDQNSRIQKNRNPAEQAPNNPNGPNKPGKEKWDKKKCDQLLQSLNSDFSLANDTAQVLRDQMDNEITGEAWSTGHMVASEGFQLGTSVASLGGGLVKFFAGRATPWVAMNGKLMSDYASVTNQGNIMDASRWLIGEQLGDRAQDVASALTIQAAGHYINSFGDALNSGQETLEVARDSRWSIQRSFDRVQSRIQKGQADYKSHCK